MHQRQYTQTHPWITFKFSTSTIRPETLIKLGEAVSKFDHVSGAPIPPQAAQELSRVFLTKGIHATTSIEGNTLTEDQVRQRVDGSLELPESLEYQGEEIDNLLRLLNEINDHCHGGTLPALTVDQIKYWNREALKQQPVEDGVIPGEFRTHSVIVGNVYRGAPAEDCELLMDQFIRFINDDLHTDHKAWRRPMGIIRAIIAHLYLAWIHPFGDGNGRTARLIEFYLLIEAGIPVLSAHLLSDYYNRSRQLYYRSLDRASRLPNHDEGLAQFIEYAVQGFVEGLQQQVRSIENIQLKLSWINYVHEVVNEEPSTEAWQRRQLLALVLAEEPEPVPRARVTKLTAELAEMYAGRTPKTLSRDLNELERRGLIRKEGKEVVSNRELMFAFLPATVPDPK